MHCTRALTSLALMVIFLGCGNESALRIDLRTDFVAQREFATVRVEFEPRDERALTRIRTVDVPAADFVDSRVLTRVSDLPKGALLVTASLLDARGNAFIRQRMQLTIRGGQEAVTMRITRGCLDDVACLDAAGEACIGETCHPDTCTEESPETCGPAECAVNSDCVAAAPCGVGACVSGVCFYGSDSSMCAAGEWCNPDLGCLPVPPEYLGLEDAGTADGGTPDMGDAGEDAGGCGSCDDDNPCTDEVCVGTECVYTLREPGTACDDGLSCTTSDRCDVVGVCVGERVSEGQCLVGGRCVDEGETHPLNACRTCQPGAGGGSWRPTESASCGGVGMCSVGGACMLPAANQAVREDGSRLEPGEYILASDEVAIGYWGRPNGCGGGSPPCGFTSGYVVLRRAGDVWTETDVLGADEIGKGVIAAAGPTIVVGTGDWRFREGFFYRDRLRVIEDLGEAAVIDMDMFDFAEGEDLSGRGDEYSLHLLGHLERDLVIATPSKGAVDGAGVVRVWQRDDRDVWSETQRIALEEATEMTRFGSATAGAGNRLLVQAFEMRMSEEGAEELVGVVHIFDRNAAGTWVAAGQIDPPAGSVSRSFGETMAVLDDRIVVGDGTAVHSLERVDGAWVPFDDRESGIGAAGERTSGFGQALALVDDLLVVGANDGAHFYRRDDDAGWLEVAFMTNEESSGLGSGAFSHRGSWISLGGESFFDLSSLGE